MKEKLLSYKQEISRLQYEASKHKKMVLYAKLQETIQSIDTLIDNIDKYENAKNRNTKN